MLKFDAYTRSKLAYCILTLSPTGVAFSLAGFYATVLPAVPFAYSLMNVFIGVAVIIVLTWFGFACYRWFPKQITIPRPEFRPFSEPRQPSSFDKCVHLAAMSLVDSPETPVLSYNTNHAIGGCMDGRTNKPILMAQFLHHYFNGGDDDPCSFDFELFKQYYHHADTCLYNADGKPLDKDSVPEPTLYKQGMRAAEGSKNNLPKGAVLVLRLPESAEPRPRFAILLCNTQVEDNEERPNTDMELLLLSLRALWKVAVSKVGLDGGLYLPILGTGNGNWEESKYCAIWTIVSTYRQAYKNRNRKSNLHVCITPEELRGLNISIVLKLMTYALYG